MKNQLQISYQEMISLENLLEAWKEFLPGKKGKQDVQEFAKNLFDNVIALHKDLLTLSYVHGSYASFTINDPKRRDIHKASVRDRVLHHAIYRKLYPLFDKTFIFDSYSCRIDKGTHKAVIRFSEFARRGSQNQRKTVWVLKCDIKKFFASIEHKKLLEILEVYIPDKNILWLLKHVIESFEISTGKGLPLGNLTSQLFCNIYMNKFDQFIKHKLKAKCYIRYADDFVLFSQDRNWLLKFVFPKIMKFLAKNLNLQVHKDKIVVKTLASGMDFLGWINFPQHRVLRKTTKRRMLRRIRENSQNSTLQSYLGMLSHGSTYKIQKKVLNDYYIYNIY